MQLIRPSGGGGPAAHVCQGETTVPRKAPLGNCLQVSVYINDTRLDYVVSNLSTATTNTVTTQHINTRYGFGGTFFGCIAARTVSMSRALKRS